MKETIIAIIAALFGIMIIGVSVYYLIKEKNDKESKKIYTISSLVGAVIAIGALVILLF